jgi:RNA recognition motif-containing protein
VATRIYVGNLPYNTNDQQLAQLFSAFGEVVEATVVIDRATNQSKGFGFVQMADDDAAHNAIASLNGTMVGNRTIRVNEAQPRTDGPRGPRGGGYGGGYGGGGYGGGGYGGGSDYGSGYGGGGGRRDSGRGGRRDSGGDRDYYSQDRRGYGYDANSYRPRHEREY